MNELAIDGPVNDGSIRSNEIEPALEGFEHISRLPVVIDCPLNAECVVMLDDVLCIRTDDGDDVVNLACPKGMDDGTEKRFMRCELAQGFCLSHSSAGAGGADNGGKFHRSQV